jgi:hypothetical protein
LAWLKTIDFVAKQIDQSIYPNHVGNFEIIWFWHNWDEKIKPKDWNNWNNERKLQYGVRKYIRRDGPQATKYSSLLRYYENS